uniref:DUF667 domain-containing protein n=1 Tax=Heterorhabditis bacteriophora TaxID=37862 RepID=A0A1I7WZ73_HETBA
MSMHKQPPLLSQQKHRMARSWHRTYQKSTPGVQFVTAPTICENTDSAQITKHLEHDDKREFNDYSLPNKICSRRQMLVTLSGTTYFKPFVPKFLGHTRHNIFVLVEFYLQSPRGSKHEFMYILLSQQKILIRAENIGIQKMCTIAGPQNYVGRQKGLHQVFKTASPDLQGIELKLSF